MSQKFPQWVKERAAELANRAPAIPGTYDPHMVGLSHNGALNALAEFIAKYEEAPLDPGIEAAEEYFETEWENLKHISKTGWSVAIEEAFKKAFVEGRKSK